jgi:hypothetical protein
LSDKRLKAMVKYAERIGYVHQGLRELPPEDFAKVIAYAQRTTRPFYKIIE